MTKRVAIYLRVSTDGQTTENQRQALEEVLARARWTLFEVYEDQGISGAKGRDSRPAFDRLCKDATRRKFDIVMAWSVDRLGRSLQDLVGFLADMQALGVDLYLHQQAVDTTSAAGKALFQMMGVFAEFERAMIRDRVLAGLARARFQGKRLGRPRVAMSVEQAVLDLRRQQKGIRKIATELGVGVGTVHRIVRAADEAAPNP